MADQNLDAQPYNQEREKVTWESCTLRNWLNDVFYYVAFSDTEQNMINIADTDDDKIYLLSDDDIIDKKYGFDERIFPETRISTNTPYTQACGAYTKDNAVGYWWINNRHNNSNSGDVVNDSNIAYIPKDVDDPTGAVRPCLHIDLSSSTWTKAGTVCSNGEVTDKSIAELVTTTAATTTTTQTHVIQVPQITTPIQTPQVTAATTTQAPKDKINPTVKGVKNKKIYKKAVTIKFSDKGSGIKKATLNGKKIKTGKKVKKNGKYTLKVYDKAGNCTTVKFTIRIKKKK